jgi:hypothetical protein
MSIFSRPDADVTNEGYVNEAAASSGLFASIDEVAADDNDYIVSAAAPTNDVYVCSLSNIADPGVSSGHVVRYRYRKSSAGGASISLVAELRQGYVSEGTQGTLIASAYHSDISSLVSTGQISLSEAEANSITNYNDLFIRFVYNQA